MLFNSYVFVLLFLPLAVIGFYAAGRFATRWALLWLLACSLFFYGYWDVRYLPLLLFSIGFNFAVGTWLRRLAARQDPRRWYVLAGAIAEELAMLGVFKYANFFVDNVNAATAAGWELAEIVLPLGISFYTFQQIAYLVDTARGEIRLRSFLDYATTVSFFPHLIAGPIILYREILPQFAARTVTRFDHGNFALGVTFFVVGLFKKVIVADWMALYATPVFDAARDGAAPSLVEAWGGALAYTLQLYFDFSGYSDMAIGLGLMFNIRLPVNFNSPYKAASIVEFWRRWHITLSHFLRQYLYIPLGGSRRGPARQHLNIILTMALAGLWHGAGWTFVLWGLFHGVLLSVNHLWRSIRAALGFPAAAVPSGWGLWAGRAVTLLAVVIGWVVFRAETLGAARRVLGGMAGLNGVALSPRLEPTLAPVMPLLLDLGVTIEPLALFHGGTQALGIASLLAIVLLAPNSHELLRYGQPLLAAGPADLAPRAEPARHPGWRPSPGWAVATGLVFVYTLTRMSKVSEFLYFQF